MPEITSMQDVLKLQQEFTQYIADRRPTEYRKLTAEELVAELAAELESTKEAIKQTRAERDSILKHWDAQIERLNERVEKQSKALKRLNKEAKASKRAKPAVTDPGTRPAAAPESPSAPRTKSPTARKK